MSDAILQLDGVETCYGQSQVLFGVGLSIAPGEIVTLMGRNGMGKTTSVRSIMGLTMARAGSIKFMGEQIRGLPAYRIAQRGIGLVPEGRQIFPNLTVRENLVATAVARDGGEWTLERVFDLFPRLAERTNSMGNQLSGGEQQMLAVGRGLMLKPRLLMLDEPSLGLAPVMCDVTFDKIQEIHRMGTAILLVEQNVSRALTLVQRAYVLESGKIIMHGTSAELADNKQVQAAYLGI